MIHDFTPGAKWSNLLPLFIINHHLLLLRYEEGKTFIMSFDEDQPISTPTPSPQNYDWAENIRTSTHSQDRPNINSVTDSKGNYYTSIHHIPTNKRLTLEYNRQFLAPLQTNKIIKLSNKGSFLHAIDMPDNKNKSTPIAINSNDELVAATTIQNNVLVGDQPYSSQDGNFLVSTFESNGQLKWVKQFNIGLNGTIDNIVVKDDQIFIVGKYSGKLAQFGQHTLHAERNFTTFLIQLTKTGEVGWVTQFPLPTIWPIDKKSSPIAASKDLVYILQRLKEKQRLQNCTNTKHRFKLIAIQKSSGQIRWEKEIISPSFSMPIDMAVSPKDQISIIGAYMNQIQFNDQMLSSDSCDQVNFFHIDLDQFGQILKAERLDSDYRFLTQVEYDADNNMYITGTKLDSSYWGIPTFNIYSFTHKVMTISKYNPFGELINTRQIHQHSYFPWDNDLKPQICFSTNQNVVFSCIPNSRVDTFNITYALEAPVFHNFFFMQYHLEDDAHLDADGHIQPSDIHISPNPARNYLDIRSQDIDFTDASVTIYTIDGKQWNLPRDQNHGLVKINTSTLPAGTYIVAIQLGDQLLAQKFIKI